MEFRIKGGPPGERAAFELRMGESVEQRTGRTMHRYRRIDRREDVYHELVVDPTTGEVVHEQSERLTDHRGHGDARGHRPD